METYSPSIDWGNELVPSLLWILKTWTISAAVVLIICALLMRYTVWGRQFWRVSGDYFKGPESAPVWGLFAILLVSVIVSVRIDVLLSYYSNDLFTSLQTAFQAAGAGDEQVRDSGIDGFWFAILIFAVLATIFVVRYLLDIYLMQRFIIRWRVWLTDRVTADWLDHRAYYRGRFIDHTIDNPDQRIQQDIDIFTTGWGTTPNIPSYGTGNVLLFGAVESVLSVMSFAAILWNLSGPLTLWGFTLPKAMFVIVFVYVLIATVVAFWIGRPLIRLSFRNELFNAAFRYALVRLRDAAEAVGFYRGERAERRSAEPPFRRHHRQLPPLRGSHPGIHRLEHHDRPGHQSAALDRAGASVVRQRNHVRRRQPDVSRIRQHLQRVVVLPQRLRPVRRLSRGDHPPARPGGRQREGPRPADAGHRALHG